MVILYIRVTHIHRFQYGSIVIGIVPYLACDLLGVRSFQNLLMVVIVSITF